MFKKAPRILFFIEGDAPSKKEYALAARMGPNTVFRNAAYVPSEGSLETCDGVTGAVPTRYAEAYPSGDAAIEAYNAALDADLAEAEDDGNQQALDLQPVTPAAPVQPAPAAKVTPAPAAPAAKAGDAGWTPNAPATAS